jgi:hypothetical protein
MKRANIGALETVGDRASCPPTVGLILSYRGNRRKRMNLIDNPLSMTTWEEL